MLARLISGVCLILAWLSTFILGAKNFRRYAPIAIIAVILVTTVEIIATRLKWWRFKKLLFPWTKSADLAYIIGPFFVGTIWIFTLTYKLGFRYYMIVNIIIDSLFAYVWIPLLERVRLIELTRITRTGINVLMLGIAVVIYPLQKLFDR